MKSISSPLDKGIEILNGGGLICIPTETVYGLAANAYCEKAVRKIFRLKQRPSNNPLIVHIASISQLETVAIDVPDLAMRLADAFWPGPLTLVLKKHPSIPGIVTAGRDTVAVRIPDHQLSLALLDQLGYPLAAPSANRSGSISPTSAAHVVRSFGEKAPYVLDGGPCKLGLESTIIGFLDDKPVLYRHGSVPLEQIENICGKVETYTNAVGPPRSPGMLSKHYSPSTRTLLSDNPRLLASAMRSKGNKIGLLLFDGAASYVEAEHIEILSDCGDLSQAAMKLYSALHDLDQKKLDVIIAEKVPDTGIGRAINDRLIRASS